MRRSKAGWGSWATMAMQGTLLALEAQQVIALRMAKLAMGDADHRETERMVTEKIDAMVDSGHMMFKAAIGGDPDMGAQKVMKRYRTTVRANRKRLSK